MDLTALEPVEPVGTRLTLTSLVQPQQRQAVDLLDQRAAHDRSETAGSTGSAPARISSL